MVSVIGVFGVSGVGKSWLISRFAATKTVLHVQASQLLRDARVAICGRVETQEELRTGAVLDNQVLLVEAFARLRASAATSIVFDGHSVVDAGDRLIDIPVDVIRAIAPQELIFVKDEPAAIVARRASDTTRMRLYRSEKEIRDHQIRAEALCGQYAETLGLNLITVRAGDEVSFSAAVSSALAGERRPIS